MNPHGLVRSIPEQVRRQVRRECGFGCVYCGAPIVEYHHITPYSQIAAHVAADIALLCPTHHSQVTAGTIPNDHIRNLRSRPYCLEKGRCEGADVFYLEAPVALTIGTNTFRDFDCIVRNSRGDEWLSIEPPAPDSKQIQLSVSFYNPDGSRSLKISRNVWDCPVPGTWDMRLEGKTFRLWQDRRIEVLRLKADPPHDLAIERLLMRYENRGIEITREGAVSLHLPEGAISMTGIETGNKSSIFTVY